MPVQVNSNCTTINFDPAKNKVLRSMWVYNDSSQSTRAFTFYLNDNTQINVPETLPKLNPSPFLTTATNPITKWIGFRSNSSKTVLSLALMGVNDSCINDLKKIETAGVVWNSLPSFTSQIGVMTS